MYIAIISSLGMIFMEIDSFSYRHPFLAAWETGSHFGKHQWRRENDQWRWSTAL